MKKPTALIILDGFGLRDSTEGNAVSAAKTPNVDWLNEKAPHSHLAASGGSVGLMDGQMGGSNVGHLNIGAGRIVYQDVVRISKAIASGEFFTNPTLLAVMEHPKKTGGALHLMGLVSPGGVHSHSEHLYALLRMAKEHGLERVFVHAFLDGRDVPPSSAHEYLADLEEQIEQIGIGRVASISGRYYAMDRDRRWDRVEKAYRALLGQGPGAPSSAAAIQEAYAQGETDEFVVPRVIVENGKAVGPIQDGDSVLFFNFRADRAREITWAMTNDDFQGFDRGKKLDIYYATMTQYDAELDLPFAFAPQDLRNTLGEYLSGLGKTQLRIAETEKYAHVTFFFNGGQETPFPGEERILVPSPKVPTYDLQPEMSAPEVTRRVVEAIKSGKYDLVVCNYANGDMVGHTGKLDAAIKAAECLDQCVQRVVEALDEVGGEALITADHGNCEQMTDPKSGQVHTSHTIGPVPLVYTGHRNVNLKDDGSLCDIAPTLLTLMGLQQPQEMSGHSLAEIN